MKDYCVIKMSQNRRGSGATGGFNPFAWYEQNKNVKTGFVNGGIGVIDEKPGATPQAPEGGMAYFGDGYKEQEQKLAAEAEKSTPVPTGRNQPAPDGGAGSGTRMGSKPMTMDDVSVLLGRTSPGAQLINPFTSNTLPGTAASPYTKMPTSTTYDASASTPTTAADKPIKLSNDLFTDGSSVNFEIPGEAAPATGAIEYFQKSGSPNIANAGAEATTASAKPQIPPRPRGARQAEMWDRQYGRQAVEAPVETPKGPEIDKARRDAFLNADNSLAGLRAIEAQKGIVVTGNTYNIMNPNAGKEGENDFMQISKDDRDTIMRGGEGAQNLLDSYVGAIKDTQAEQSPMSDVSKTDFNITEQSTPQGGIQRDAQVENNLSEGPEGYNLTDAPKFTDKDPTGRYNKFR